MIPGVVYKRCRRHNVLVQGFCPTCRDESAARQHRRRHQRNMTLGRKSTHWRDLARRLVRSAEGVCPECGRLEDPADPGSKLTCDLIAGGDHSLAGAEDCRVMCRRCHGRLQGGRV